MIGYDCGRLEVDCFRLQRRTTEMIDCSKQWRLTIVVDDGRGMEGRGISGKVSGGGEQTKTTKKLRSMCQQRQRMAATDII